jgi:hypothetical protein
MGEPLRGFHASRSSVEQDWSAGGSSIPQSGITATQLLGSPDPASAAAKAGLALDPSFTIRRYRDGAYSDNPTFLAKRERVCEGMRLAGVPEG